MSDVLQAAALSVWVAALATGLALPLALLLSSLLHHRRWRALEFLLMLPLFWSPTVSGFLLLWLLSPNNWLGALLRDLGLRLVFTTGGTVLACFLVSFPLAYQACLLGRARIPQETEDCGRVLGGSPTFVLVTVVWPQMGAALAMGGLLVAARSLGEFGASMMVGGNLPGITQTLPLVLYTLAEQKQLHLAGWAALLSALLGGVMYALMRWSSSSSQWS